MTQPLPSRVAVHEAGHVVVNLALGMGVEYASVVPNASGSSMGRVLRVRDASCLEHEAASIVAGEVADRMILGGDRDSYLPQYTCWAATNGPSWSERRAEGVRHALPAGLLSDAADLDATLRKAGSCWHVRRCLSDGAYALARKIIGECRGAVIYIASVLDERGSMTGDELDALIAAAASAE